MDIEDILILVAAIVGWVYNNYRKLQKDAVERSGKLNIPTSIPAEQPKPAPVTVSAPQRQVIRKAIRKAEVPSERFDETKEAQEFWRRLQNDISSPAYINDDVNKKSELEESTAQSSGYINNLEEVRSGNIDWKRAIIYSEILRPVYF